MKRSNFSAKQIACAAIALGGLTASPQAQLTIEQIVRAWESPEYRQTLTQEQLAQLPENPAGEVKSEFSNSSESYEIASTSWQGCSTSWQGCSTSWQGCSTSWQGCSTSWQGCSTQFESCMA